MKNGATERWPFLGEKKQQQKNGLTLTDSKLFHHNVFWVIKDLPHFMKGNPYYGKDRPFIKG